MQATFRPLTIACVAGDVGIFHLLVSHAANIDVKDKVSHDYNAVLNILYLLVIHIRVVLLLYCMLAYGIIMK